MVIAAKFDDAMAELVRDAKASRSNPAWRDLQVLDDGT
jgi:hypothetical protein